MEKRMSHNFYDDPHGFYDAFIAMANAREFDRMHEFAHDPYVHNGTQISLAEAAADFRSHTERIPDLVWGIQDLVVEGERMAARLVNTGTPESELFGMAPTGNSLTFTEFASYRIREGRIEASWYLMDADAVRKQLAG
jgi:predicted ester cyclase